MRNKSYNKPRPGDSYVKTQSDPGSFVSLQAKVEKDSMKLSDMSDDEILEHVLEVFEEDARLNMNYIDVEVVDGSVTVNGRVTSEEELQVVNELMRDTLRVDDYKNNVWIDETLNYEDPEDKAPDIKELTFDDDEIDDREYSDEEEEEEDF